MRKKPDIAELRTFALIQSNAPKILYGSGVVGAGFKDKYQDYKTVRGRFTEKRGSTELSGGTKLPAKAYEYVIRYDSQIMAVVDLQLRFIINGKTYTLDNFDVEVFQKQEFFYFTLLQYGK
jgi:hypothetical protein